MVRKGSLIRSRKLLILLRRNSQLEVVSKVQKVLKNSEFGTDFICGD
jgi:hypothetical protein